MGKDRSERLARPRSVNLPGLDYSLMRKRRAVSTATMVRGLICPQRECNRSVEIDRTPSQRTALLTFRPASGGTTST